MWKKDSAVTLNPNLTPSQTPNGDSPLARDWESSPVTRKVSIVGSALELEGTVRGAEDILLQGKLKGRVELPRNTFTVGIEGFLEGDVFAQVVIVEGAVRGNINATERVVLHRSGQLFGNVTCERVMIEEGARVNGSIDMSVSESRQEKAPAAADEDDTENSLTH